MEIAFFDLETTIPNASHEKRRIIEIGIAVVNVDSMSVVDSHSCDVGGPGVAMLPSKRSADINHITPERVAAAAPFSVCASRVRAMMDGRLWGGHNITSFDIPILLEEFEAAGVNPPRCAGVVDTLLHARELRRAEDRSDVPPRKRPEDQKLATIAEFFAMSAETHSALDDAILSFAALEAFVARDVLRSFAILGGPRCGSVVFLSAPPGKSAAVVEIDIDNLELMAGYYPRRAATVDELAETMSKLRLDASSRVSRVAAAILTDAVWVPICSDEYESLKAHLGSIPRAHVAVACQTPSISGKWNSLESAAEILGASTAFPPRRPRTEPIRRDTVEWMRAVMIATCATKGISALASDWTMQTASRAPSAAPSDADLIAEARAVIEGKVPRNHANIAKPPGTLVEVKFKYSKPNEGAAPTVIEKTVHDPHRNPGFTTPAFDATDVTYGSGKIKTFISSRVASVASISVIRR